LAREISVLAFVVNDRLKLSEWHAIPFQLERPKVQHQLLKVEVKEPVGTSGFASINIRSELA
jgi:hypothetical protein